jgi:hypothetical protein
MSLDYTSLREERAEVFVQTGCKLTNRVPVVLKRILPRMYRSVDDEVADRRLAQPHLQFA